VANGHRAFFAFWRRLLENLREAFGIAFHLLCSLGLDQSGSVNDEVSRENAAFRSRRCLERDEEDSMRLFMQFLRNETGATAIEYGLIAAGISLAIIGIVDGMGTKLNTKFTSLNNSLK
jgi:pilus assembly protein Flp/PilA